MRVASLHIHPVKSMKALDVAVLDLQPDGARHDRQWLVIDERNAPVSIKDMGAMVLVRAWVEGATLCLAAEGRGECRVATSESVGTPLRVTVCDAGVDVVEVSHGASRWLSEVLGNPVRLVRKSEAAIRHPGYGIPALYQLGFADLAPLLVATTSSLADLNARLPSPVTMERFRPNIVIEGASAWDEDTWQTLSVGGVELECVMPDIRCAVVNVDPSTGSGSAEPLATMASFRRREKPFPGVYFGMYFRYAPGAVAAIERGAEVRVLARAAHFE